jgi:hypothetical protein
VTDMIEEWRTADMTATLTHIAGLLESLPLDGYREALAAQVAESAAWTDDEPVSDQHRRARRGALLAAVCAARDFITGMQDAMAHNRAAARAVPMEQGVRAEHAPPPFAPAPRLPESELHRVFLGAKVIPIRREEALTDDESA